MPTLIPPPDTAPEALLIPDTEAAALLGISRAHLHRLRSAGKFGPAAIRLGRALRFDRAEIFAYAAARCPDARTWQAMQASGRRGGRSS